MSNVLDKDKREQVIALGRLGWSLRRIEAAVHIRRETIGGYLHAAGIPVRPPGGWGRRSPANPANEVITDSGAESVAIRVPEPQPSRSRSGSVCEQYRDLIELADDYHWLDCEARAQDERDEFHRRPEAIVAECERRGLKEAAAACRRPAMGSSGG